MQCNPLWAGKSAVQMLAFLLSGVLAQSATALPLEAQVLQATDAGGRSLFVPNPAAYLPAKNGISYGEMSQDRSIQFTTNSDQGPATVDTNYGELSRSVGFVLGTGGKFSLGVQGNFRKEEVRSRFTNSNFANAPLEETRTHREGVGKVALEFTKELKAGVMFRYQYRKADILGNFGGGNDDRTSYAGSLYGVGVGALFQSTSAGIGAAYVTPLRGKVEVTGEKKVTTDPGYLHGSAYFDLSPQFRLGAVGERWIHEKDELTRSSTSPNRARPMTIDLRGMNPERNLYLWQRFLIGSDILFSKAAGLRVSLARETYEFVFDPESLPGKDGNDANIFHGYRARVAALFDTDLVSLQIGADYARRAHKPKPNQNSDINYKASELNFFGMAHFNL